MVIWKYKVPPPNQDNISTIVVPKGSSALSVGMQDGTMVVWVLVSNPENVGPQGYIQLLVVNTGIEYKYPVKIAQRFLGTLTADGGVVWHIFES